MPAASFQSWTGEPLRGVTLVQVLALALWADAQGSARDQSVNLSQALGVAPLRYRALNSCCARYQGTDHTVLAKASSPQTSWNSARSRSASWHARSLLRVPTWPQAAYHLPLRVRAPHAQPFSDAEFWRLFALPGTLSVGLAYWLAQQQEPVRGGDLRDKMVKEAKQARAQVLRAEAMNGSTPALLRSLTDTEFARKEVFSLGEPVRMLVGPAGKLSPQTVRVRRVLAEPSMVVTVKLEQPLGIDFEPIAGGALCRVRALDETGTAARAARIQGLAGGGDAAAPSAPRVGDVLLAFTEPRLVYDRSSQIGLTKPRRMIFACTTGERNCQGVKDALREGLLADGPVSLVFERLLREA